MGSKAHNAEATYTCGHCSKPVEDTDEYMECEYCNLWYHTACEKIKHSDYEMLVRLIANNQLLYLYLYDRLDQRRFDVMTRVPV